MLYETLRQPLIILAIFCSGILSALLFDIGNFATYFCNKNKIVKQVFYFVCVVLSSIILFYINLLVNYGRFRIYIIAIFLISFTIWRVTVGKLWTKLLDKWYNGIKEFKKRFRKKKDDRREEPKQV